MFLSNFEIPISFRWEILRENLVEESKNDNWDMISKKFYIKERPGVQYYLNLSQRKHQEHYKNKVKLGLTIEIKQMMITFKINANFKIKISSANKSFERNEIYTQTKVSGDLIGTIDEIFDPAKNFFVSDVMTIMIEGILSGEKINAYFSLTTFQSKNDTLGLKLWDRDDKDFSFIVGGNEIRVHKLIVSAESPVFDRMIQSGMKESIENKVKIIDFDFEAVEIAIKFCYGIEIGEFLTAENAVNILQFSDKYDISKLKASMGRFLISILSPLNVIEIANASILSNSPKLRKECLKFIVKCKKNETVICNLSLLDAELCIVE